MKNLKKEDFEINRDVNSGFYIVTKKTVNRGEYHYISSDGTMGSLDFSKKTDRRLF